MWMRTTVNFQYKYGMTTTEALRHIYNDGGRGVSGVLRFYKGVGPALIQGPLSRFGDTAANEGAMAIMDNHPAFENMPVALKSVGASAAAAGFRIFLMPIDCLKTTLQVEGKNGMKLLGQKLKTSGPGVLWHGSLGVVSATFVGHYPWFFTRNQMQAVLPVYDRKKETLNFLVRYPPVGSARYALHLQCWVLTAAPLSSLPTAGRKRPHRLLRLGRLGYVLQLNPCAEDNQADLGGGYFLHAGVQAGRGERRPLGPRLPRPPDKDYLQRLPGAPLQHPLAHHPRRHGGKRQNEKVNGSGAVCCAVPV